LIFKRILVAIDGSPQSKRASEYAIKISQEYNSELVALHVLYSKTGFAFYNETAAGMITPNSINELIEQGKREAENWFEDIRKIGASSNVKIKTEAVISAISVVEAIVNYSEKENIDLIITGSRGRSGFKKLFLGSTASGIMTYSHCPVMIVK
jgi:nucleotide-binding universal stress UspA family protein